MTTKKTIKKALNETSESPIKIASVEHDEARAVKEGPAAHAADSLPDAADATTPKHHAIPNVQAETNHASVAPEDTRDASVAEPRA